MNGYIYGYARVSTRSQELNRQLDLLNEQNCNEILTEKNDWNKIRSASAEPTKR